MSDLLPEGWKTEVLSNLADYYNGAAFNSKDWSEDGLPIIRIAQLNNEKAETDKYSGFILPTNYIDDDDLIFSWSATLKVVIWKKGPGALNQHLYKVVPKPGINKCLLRHLLDFNMDNLAAQSQGSTMKHVTRKELSRFQVIYPEQENEQVKLSLILESLDQTIEKTEALIHKYQQIKAGLMQDLFTRGVTVEGKLRPPREQAPELYKESPIGWIPREWEVCELESISTILDPQPDHRTPPEHQEGIPYIGIGDFDSFGDLDMDRCRKIVHKAYKKQSQRFTVESGDIIFGKIGTIGNPRILLVGKYALSANVLLIKSTIDSSFIFHSLNTDIFNRQITDITNTTSQPALGIEKVRNLLVPVPNDDKEKNRIAEFLNACCENISKNFVQLQKYQKQKSGLMHDLLTGKVQVKVDKEEPAHV